MTFAELFNLAAEESPEMQRLIGAAVDKLNAPPKIAEAALKQVVEAYTTAEETAPGAVTLSLNLEKMKQGAAAGVFPARLGLLFDGLAERGNILEGRKVTLRLEKPPQL